MKKSRPSKPSKNQLRALQALQVQEFIGRYRPDLRDSSVEISKCGKFASVCEKGSFDKKDFYIWVSDIETGDATLAITVWAPTQREAVQIGRKRIRSSPILRKIFRKIRYAAFTAVEIKH
jgi:hypothetical protein